MPKKIERFEDFIAWQRARNLTSRIYEVTGLGRFISDFGLKDQARRASVSIMSNIAEGFERGTPAEFHRFVSIAKGSCAELRSQLYVALDAGYLSQEIFESLMGDAREVGRVLGGLRLSLEQRRASNLAARSGSKSCGR
jgi:four helix bundle protein